MRRHIYAIRKAADDVRIVFAKAIHQLLASRFAVRRYFSSANYANCSVVIQRSCAFIEQQKRTIIVLFQSSWIVFIGIKNDFYIVFFYKNEFFFSARHRQISIFDDVFGNHFSNIWYRHQLFFSSRQCLCSRATVPNEGLAIYGTNHRNQRQRNFM